MKIISAYDYYEKEKKPKVEIDKHKQEITKKEEGKEGEEKNS